MLPCGNVSLGIRRCHWQSALNRALCKTDGLRDRTTAPKALSFFHPFARADFNRSTLHRKYVRVGKLQSNFKFQRERGLLGNVQSKIAYVLTGFQTKSSSLYVCSTTWRKTPQHFLIWPIQRYALYTSQPFRLNSTSLHWTLNSRFSFISETIYSYVLSPVILPEIVRSVWEFLHGLYGLV